MAIPPERSKGPINVFSLNAAYHEMHKQGLAIVPASSPTISHAKEHCKMNVVLGEVEATWDLVQVVKKTGRPTNLRDGIINDDRKSLENPVSSVPKVTKTPSKVVNSTKTRRRQRMTDAKVKQLQDSRLFCVERRKPARKRGKRRNSKTKEGKRKQQIKQVEETKQELKKSKRYRHLQDFIERRRQLKLQRRCRRRGTLDPSAQVPR